jgi:hypothetical protein
MVDVGEVEIALLHVRLGPAEHAHSVICMEVKSETQPTRKYVCDTTHTIVVVVDVSDE